MTVLRAFRGLRYDISKIELADVIVPPYDVITAEGRETLYQRDPHNAVRLELTRSVKDEADTDYSEVSETLSRWISSGVLVQDEAPALYAFRQRFEGPDGEELVREGFFGELGLASYDERVVLPHERTLAGPKADRLKMLRATRANLSSVFVLYEDREESIARVISAAFEAGRSATAIDDAGIEQSLAPITDPQAIATIRALLADRPVVIADGHHRYETALAYRDEQRDAHGADAEAACESTLAYFSNAFAPGSLLLPIHRVVRRKALPAGDAWRERLGGWDTKRVEGATPETIAELLAEHLSAHADAPAFALDDGSGALDVYWKKASEPQSASADDLMVSILEREILGEVFGLDIEAIRHGAVIFKQKPEVAAQEVRTGEGAVALYLNPLTPDDVFRVTRAGGLMPQKSTFFFPKIPTGLVFRLHGDARERRT